MTVRAYLSNISKALPLAAQEEAHAKGTPGWPRIPTYRDELGPGALMAHSPAALIERANLLRPTGRRPAAEAIYVASLSVLAWVPEDFMACLAAATARHSAVVALDTGRRIEPTAGAVELRAALREFMTARRRVASGQSLKQAAQKQAAIRRADVAERVKLIAEDWPLRAVPTAELQLRAGRMVRKHMVPMAYATIIQHLGSRPLAQKRHERAVERERRRKTK